MSKAIAENYDEIVKPVKVTYKPTGEQYILDFSRASALFAQERGFDPSQLGVKPLIIIPELFYYSLRKNHKNIARNQAEKLFEKLFPDGIPVDVLERLAMLYQQAMTIHIIAEEEDDAKNADTEVE